MADPNSKVRPKEALSSFSTDLLEWFDGQKRDLPWRRTGDPYAIWVSEVMLQQTRVETVRAYYERWMMELPTLQSLADSSEQKVLELWQGLGYYSRARRLRQGARFVCDHHNGKLPPVHRELLSVPGIGPYSAGAIGSIAFGIPEPAIDGNVIRVMSRLFCISGSPAKKPHQREVEVRTRELMPKDRPGDYNQALMELGATVCTPKSPLCGVCPVHRHCRAFREGRAPELPERVQRATPTQVLSWVFILEHESGIEVKSLSEGARWWAGLVGLPTVEMGEASGGAMTELSPVGSPAETEDAEPRSILEKMGLPKTPFRLLPEVNHQVTRFRLVFRPVLVHVDGDSPLAGERILSVSELTRAALPAPFRKILHSYFAFGSLAQGSTARAKKGGPRARAGGRTRLES
jgi:A/G-specific adenine glycosylase